MLLLMVTAESTAGFSPDHPPANRSLAMPLTIRLLVQLALSPVEPLPVGSLNQQQQLANFLELVSAPVLTRAPFRSGALFKFAEVVSSASRKTPFAMTAGRKRQPSYLPTRVIKS